MKRLLCWLLWLLLPCVLFAANPLENARRAQAMLGPEIWSRVICVENTALHSIYPGTVHALVFEEAGLLWFYTDTDGTQSFSLHRDRLAGEKADFAPLLSAIDPGFTRYEILPDALGENPRAGAAELPNGCFIASLAALRERVRRGERIERARLLSCYVDTPVGRRGHTLLTYETPRGLFLLDPALSPEPRAMPRAWADNALALAGVAFPGVKVARARWVPTSVPVAAILVAALDTNNDRVPGGAPRLMR